MITHKLRYKLVIMFFVTSVLPLLALGLFTVYSLGQMGLNQARERIESNLDISVSIYQSAVDNLKFVVRDANRRAFVLMEEDQLDLLKNELVNYCRTNHLDFFVITDAGGKVIVSMSNPALEGTDLNTDKFVKRALRFQISASSEMMGKDELEHLGLASQASLGFVNNQGALVLKATSPVINRNEIIIGTIQAGCVLNNNNAIIISEIKKRTGLDSSVFMGNTRVATTITSAGGHAEVGGHIDEAGAASVLRDGKRYMTTIKLGGMKYLAGYTPLYDSASNVIGMLAVSIPEKDIYALRNRLITSFAVAVLIAMMLSLAFGARKGGRLVSSVKKLRRGIEAFGRGDLHYRVKIKTADEFEELAGFFNRTMDQLLSAKQQLAASTLNVERLENTVTESMEQLHAAQKRLLEVERMAAMGRMGTALSHELRNIFAEISGGIYNLKNKLSASSPELVASLQGISESLEHASKIISHVLSFSYPKKPILSLVDLNYLIEDMLAMPNMRELLKRNNIKLEKSLSSDVPGINADGLQLRETVMNLVVNAIQAMPDGGKLSITTELDQGFIRVRVEDTGKGIEPDVMEQMFTPFFTTKSRGLGLGLCISKTIAEEHGGSIHVDSRVNQGTTFTISLPAAGKKVG